MQSTFLMKWRSISPKLCLLCFLLLLPFAWSHWLWMPHLVHLFSAQEVFRLKLSTWMKIGRSSGIEWRFPFKEVSVIIIIIMMQAEWMYCRIQMKWLPFLNWTNFVLFRMHKLINWPLNVRSVYMHPPYTYRCVCTNNTHITERVQCNCSMAAQRQQAIKHIHDICYSKRTLWQ